MNGDKIKAQVTSIAIENNLWQCLPVRLEILAEKLGFTVKNFVPDSKSNEISGAVDHQSKMIFINSDQVATRRLFTLAHELGHAVLHPGEHVDYRSNIYTSECPREKEANYFAACLLMPDDAFVREWQASDGDINHVSRFFGVSSISATIQAQHLGLVSGW